MSSQIPALNRKFFLQVWRHLIWILIMYFINRQQVVTPYFWQELRGGKWSSGGKKLKMKKLTSQTLIQKFIQHRWKKAPKPLFDPYLLKNWPSHWIFVLSLFLQLPLCKPNEISDPANCSTWADLWSPSVGQWGFTHTEKLAWSWPSEVFHLL